MSITDMVAYLSIPIYLRLTFRYSAIFLRVVVGKESNSMYKTMTIIGTIRKHEYEYCRHRRE